MPSGVFKPYAGVSTAVLFFTKTGTGGTDKVWFYDMTADGYSLDDKRAEIKDNDIPDIIERFHSLTSAPLSERSEDIRTPLSEQSKDIRTLSGAEVPEYLRLRTDKSFLVPFSEIKANDWDLSINRYKEIEYEEIVYEKPTDIIAAIEALDQERNQALTALKEMLK